MLKGIVAEFFRSTDLLTMKMVSWSRNDILLLITLPTDMISI